MKRKTKVDTNRLVLLKIADMGKGLKPEVIDWTNIGKNAVRLAQDAIAEKCKCCGKIL